MSLDTLIREVQASLGLVVDGKPGPATWGAIHARITGKSALAAAPLIPAGQIDPRSESVISTLHPRVQTYARNLVLKAAAMGINVRIISGLRTYEEQTALYAQGRGKPGKIVTNAPAGYSNHNFGLAFDIGIFEKGKYLEDGPQYKAVAPLGIDMGLTWGGSWKSIQDQPHYELRPAWAAALTETAMLKELRTRKVTGVDYFA